MILDAGSTRAVCRGRFVLVIALALALGLGQVATATALHAQTAEGGRNKDQPIEITANELTVRQQENLAIFRGDVDAVQGDTSLKADELRVFYVSQDGNVAGGGGNNIRRIEASGNVLLAQPDQSAAGDRGVYDVPNDKVTLTGNVVLSNPENIVRGSHLDYDLGTGVATVSAGGTEGSRTSRVRAVFQAQPVGQQGQR
jgi:lipopolysaccharide export system protein LptA